VIHLNQIGGIKMSPDKHKEQEEKSTQGTEQEGTQDTESVQPNKEVTEKGEEIKDDLGMKAGDRGAAIAKLRKQDVFASHISMSDSMDTTNTRARSLASLKRDGPAATSIDEKPPVVHRANLHPRKDKASNPTGKQLL
jgi:cell division septation protein DedD